MADQDRKILILTQPLHLNYGGVLQAYALQRVLREMGHDVVTDRHVEATKQWNPPFYRNNVVYHYAWQIFRLLTGRRPIYWRYPFCSYAKLLEKLGAEILRFTRDNISTIEFFDREGRVKEQYKGSFDTYIVGSDQVWYAPYNEVITNYFLGFLDSDDDVKRFAYAASFGVDNIDALGEQLRQRCSRYLSRFNAVSVREEDGIKLCREEFGVESTLVLDPTILLKKDDYIALCSDEKCEQGVVYSYILDRNKTAESVCSHVAVSLKLPIVSRCALGRYPVVAIKDATTPSIESWLAGYRDAEFVVTDSYHGTIFAIIFEKPFITITNHQRGASRFVSLLKMLGLESRLIDHDAHAEQIERLISTKIDYETVRQKLYEQRQKSVRYLNQI